jgi:uncharacterized protein
MKKSIIFLILLMSLLIFPIVNAQQGHMRLLAVSETSEGEVGGIADLFLEIKEGSGRVFLETFPLTRVDTQISTRFAKQIACDFADADCDNYDFFYTITADSPIIAGPSAGAAISVLTFSLIADVELDEDVAITGTINSGGIIGPVGGLNAKIYAAERVGLKKVLIPIGESIEQENRTLNQSMNESFNLEKLRKIRKIDIIEVPTLDDALFEFTGKRFKEKKANLTINEEYQDTMKILAIQLCSRSTKLRNRISNISDDNDTRRLLDNSINLSVRGKDSFSDNTYYSSASYCFGANVGFNHIFLLNLNLTGTEVISKINEVRREIKDFDEIIDDESIKTITDLESYMIVKERLIDASEFLDLVQESVDNNDIDLRNLAYAMERVNSAKSWSQFLENTGKEFDFNDQVVESACRTKLSEVEERLQYVQFYIPQNLENTRKELEYAYDDLREGNFELCLFKASKAKANVDTVLSVFGVRNENVAAVLDQKLGIVERNLVEVTEKGLFPIVGYSYFEYANSLKENDPFSALLYSEYALELSGLDIYFKSATGNGIRSFNIDKNLLLVLIVGIGLGIVVSKITSFRTKKSRKKK